jgi:hypothetical protein
MKAFLMFPDRDFPMTAPLVPNAAVLVKDLELEMLFTAMADDDAFVLEVARRALLMSLDSPHVIRYRQAILADSLQQAVVVRELYAIAEEALEREKKVWGWTSMRSSPEGTLMRSREVLGGVYFDLLKRLRRVAEEHASKFQSEGFSRLFELLVAELSDEFLVEVSSHLEGLALREQMVMSAELGNSNEGVHYILRKPRPHQGWWQRVQEWRAGTLRKEPTSYAYEIHPRDEQGARALSELRGKGVARVAAALGESTEHLTSFFEMLRRELAFYVGCLNLRERLLTRGAPFCLPDALPVEAIALSAEGLYDVALSLKSEGVVGNTVEADEKALIFVTGANRGGKSTFLRSVGQAQLMMQAGLFVGAEAFRANVCSGLFTHYKKEEDASMKSGKLDEELSRMSAIVDEVKPRALVLCNESFGSTNEREGSEIARQIVSALLEHQIKVLYVTHMYELAQGFYARAEANSLFLRAERLPDETRTFRMDVGEPLETSYGADLYRRIFKREPEAVGAS